MYWLTLSGMPMKIGQLSTECWRCRQMPFVHTISNILSREGGIALHSTAPFLRGPVILNLEDHWSVLLVCSCYIDTSNDKVYTYILHPEILHVRGTQWLSLSQHMSQVAHQGGAYPLFCSMKWLGIFVLPLDRMVVHRSITPSIKFGVTCL